MSSRSWAETTISGASVVHIGCSCVESCAWIDVDMDADRVALKRRYPLAIGSSTPSRLSQVAQVIGLWVVPGELVVAW